MLNVLAKLSVSVQKPNLIWPAYFLFLWLGTCRFCEVKLLVLLGSPGGYFLHEHQYLVDPGYIPLDFCDVMLEYCCFDTLSTTQALHDACIFIANVSFNYSFDGFNFIEPMVKSNDLSNQLGPLWNK